MPKKIMHKFTMNAISTVDNPAQAGATAVIMKRDSSEDLAKIMFDEVLVGMEIEEQVRGAMDEMWKLDSALRTSIYSIVDDKDEYPDTLKSVKNTLSQYVSAISSLLTEAVDEADVEVNKTVTHFKEAWSIANPSEDLPGVLKSKEDSMPNEPTVESLQKNLEEKDQELLVAKTYGELGDAEKNHYAKLEDQGKGTFLGMTPEQRSSEVAKATEEDPVVFTTGDGIEIRKSADPLMLSLAKQADKNAKENLALKKANEDADLEKRVSENMATIPGDTSAKIALLKAVDGIEDKETKESVLMIIKAHNDTAVLSLDKLGDRGEDILEGEAEIEKKAKEYQKDHKIESYEQAYSKFLETEEGKELYKRMNE